MKSHVRKFQLVGVLSSMRHDFINRKTQFQKGTPLFLEMIALRTFARKKVVPIVAHVGFWLKFDFQTSTDGLEKRS